MIVACCATPKTLEQLCLKCSYSTPTFPMYALLPYHWFVKAGVLLIPVSITHLSHAPASIATATSRRCSLPWRWPLPWGARPRWWARWTRPWRWRTFTKPCSSLRRRARGWRWPTRWVSQSLPYGARNVGKFGLGGLRLCRKALDDVFFIILKCIAKGRAI